MATTVSDAKTSTPGVQGLWWKLLCGLSMIFVIYGAFFIAKGAVQFVGTGDISRIIFFHVPVAIQCSLWFFVSGYYSLRVLQSAPGSAAKTDADIKASTSMELGFIASILATITGSVFARVEWNSYWNWDPREISIVGLLLIYAAYLMLRGSVGAATERRAQLCAVYAVVTLIPATFVTWVVPRIPALLSMHPPNVIADAGATSPTYKVVLYTSFVSFTILFIWLFQMRTRVQKISAQRRARIVQ